MPPSGSSAKPKLKGRHWVMFWLLVFLAMSVLILARQTSAIQAARQLAQLREQRVGLEAERAALERAIHEATSRQVLGRIAEEELGLHFPADSELKVLPLKGRR